jgi:hypothetical protein
MASMRAFYTLVNGQSFVEGVACEVDLLRRRRWLLPWSPVSMTASTCVRRALHKIEVMRGDFFAPSGLEYQGWWWVGHFGSDLLTLSKRRASDTECGRQERNDGIIRDRYRPLRCEVSY